MQKYQRESVNVEKKIFDWKKLHYNIDGYIS